MQVLIKIFISFTLLFISLSSYPSDSSAQNGELANDLEVIKPDKYGRRTPRGTIEGFLSAIAEEDFDLAAAYLNLSYLPKSERVKTAPELASKLQYLLDHSGKLDASVLISEYSQGHLKDGLDLNIDKVGALEINDESVPVLLEQVRDEDNLAIWLISSETLKKIPKKIKFTKKLFVIDDYLPAILFKNKIIGVSAVHWFLVIFTMLISYAIAKIIISLFLISFRKSVNKYLSDEKIILVTALHIPARLWLSVYIFITLIQYLSVPIIMRSHFNSLAVAIYLVALLLLLWQVTNILHIVFTEKFKQTNNSGIISIIDFIRRSIRFILITAGILIGLHLYDHNVTTGLAALGIGGLAIALGAQKTLENIAGSINVVVDQTVNNGDLCEVAGILGWVEQVGIRSTKIRTFKRTVVTIPNAEFSNHTVENYSKRDKTFFDHKIGIRYETSPDQIRYLLVTLRSMFYAHPKVYNDPQMVKLIDFGADSLIIRLTAYIKTTDMFEFFDIREDLLLKIIQIVEQSGTSFAFPSQTVYLSKDSGLSKELTTQAEGQVNAWKSNGDLQLPRFTDEKIKELSDSLTYPEPGSALYEKD